MTVTDRYLARLGLEQAPEPSLAGLAELQLRHLIAVPFENLDVWMQQPVSVDPHAATAKIVDRGRGGWCFELNGAFAEFLRSLGFEVLVLGVATLLDGPNDLVDHIALEVMLDQPYLVDVGFGRHSPTEPIPLNATTHTSGHQTFEFLPSPRGTTLAVHRDGVPAPLCRFKRVGHNFEDFAGASQRLQSDPTSIFTRSPFATRLIDRRGTRQTWSSSTLTTDHVDGSSETEPAPRSDWNAVLRTRFSITGVDAAGFQAPRL